jgi:hypothetical protein
MAVDCVNQTRVFIAATQKKFNCCPVTPIAEMERRAGFMNPALGVYAAPN